MTSDYFEKFKKTVKDNRMDILIIIGLFLFAFGIRAIPYENPGFKGVYGFDPTWHARMIRFVVTDGQRPLNEPISYWPDNPPIDDPPLYHYASAYGYHLVALATTGNPGYQEDLFFKYVAFLPAIAGGLAAAGMYLLGKEIRGKKAGTIAALFMAVQPTVLFRSMYGFAEEDAIGIALTIITFAAYAWALKNGGWKRGLIAGLALLSLIMTWTFSPFTLAFLALLTVVNAVLLYIGGHHKEIERKLEAFTASLLPVLLIPLFAIAWNWYMPTAITEMVKWAGFFIPVIFVLGAISYYKNYYGKENKTKIADRFDRKKAYEIGLVCIAILGIAFLAMKGQWMMDYVNGLFKIVGQSSKLMLTVGEEHPKTMAGVLGELNWLAIPFILGLVYLPIRRLIKLNDPKNMDMLPFLLAAITFYLYINKGKMGYIFGPGEVILLGVVFADLVGLGDWIIKTKRASQKTGEWIKLASIALVAILFFPQLGIGIAAVEQQKVNYLPQPQWTDMYDYLKAQPNNDELVLMTWWDYGHWTAWNNIKTTLDNTNYNSTKVIKTARIFTDLRGNSSAELEENHLEEMRDWGVTHLAVDRTLLIDKWGALTFLADNNCIPTADLKKYGMEFPTLSALTENAGVCAGSVSCPSGYGCTHSGEIGMAYCEPKQTIGDNGTENIVVCYLFQGTPLKFSESEWNEIVNAKWPGYDLTINTGEGLQTFKVYGQTDYKLIYFKIGTRILQDAPVNHMLGLRWFFEDPTLEYTHLVKSSEYNLPNHEVVLYAVDYSGSSEPGTIDTNPFD